MGTKNLVADAMLGLTGKSFYRNIGVDTVATIVNDLITTGALPISVAMHAAVGDSAWFENTQRATDLASGFAEGCVQSHAVWGGGETPALRGIVDASTIVLAGSAIGRIRPKNLRITGNVRDGDAIILLASSGVQTNGLSLCRAIADQLPGGYLTKMSDGRTYGEGLLDPSVIYVNFIAACQRAGIDLHYAAHITGHGWRKLMRLSEPFVYEMHATAPPGQKSLPIFDFLASSTGRSSRRARCTQHSTWVQVSRCMSIQPTPPAAWKSPGKPSIKHGLAAPFTNAATAKLSKSNRWASPSTPKPLPCDERFFYGKFLILHVTMRGGNRPSDKSCTTEINS